MKQCPNCSNMVNDDDIFCGKCGWKFDDPYNQFHQKQDYEVIEESNFTFHALQRFLMFQKNIEIKNIKLAISYKPEGILSKFPDWYVTRFIIQYQKTSETHLYNMAWASFPYVNTPHQDEIQKEINRYVPKNADIIFQGTKQIQMKNESKWACRIVIYEEYA